jgi:dolichol-phosphate mannosyltransferase
VDFPHLSVVLPAYSEEENLRLLLPRIQSELHKLGCTWEVIVVDTIQPLDHTPEVCEQNLVRYVPRRGGNEFGDAVKTGIAEAQGEFILFMDSDGSHPPEFIRSLFVHATHNDVVIASRYIAGGFSENNAPLIWMSRILNLTYSIVLNLKCKDVSNSFKIYRAILLKSLRLRCSNFDIVEEILFRIKREHPNLRIHEVPFSFKKRMFGQTKRNLIWFMLTYLFTLIRLRCSK